MVSVIIPSFNGDKNLPVILRALNQQTTSDFEVIVVVDGSTDRSLEVLEAFKPLIFTLKTVYQKNAGRSRARNAGVDYANGDLLIFYDDDVEPDMTSIEKHVSLQMKKHQLVCGYPIERQLSSKSDIQNYKAHITTAWVDRFSSGANLLDKEDFFFTAANCSLSKQIFTELNGFDTRLSAAEDFDLGYRALKLNYDVIFDKSNIATHHDYVTCRSYIERQKQYLVGHRTLAQLHPELKPKSRKPISRIKNLAYSILRASIFVTLVDHFNLFLLFPTKIRYKIYDAIIWAHSQI